MQEIIFLEHFQWLSYLLKFQTEIMHLSCINVIHHKFTNIITEILRIQLVPGIIPFFSSNVNLNQIEQPMNKYSTQGQHRTSVTFH